MRLGYNWKFGPFELLDQLGADDVAARLMEEGRAVPLLLQQAVEAGGFYRVKDGRLQYLTVEGDYAKVERRGCAERKSVVKGKRVSVRVDFGVRRIIEKQNKPGEIDNHQT